MGISFAEKLEGECLGLRLEVGVVPDGGAEGIDRLERSEEDPDQPGVPLISGRDSIGRISRSAGDGHNEFTVRGLF
ncbi:unnamed protein product [Linum tenue]|uniref:Uncharacterized protein n=1 Tax=Linum tenue TaxID=586396 RepID=A0AAV0L5E1_9ROSI|nr:unnamed protein product [Linum tenue]